MVGSALVLPSSNYYLEGVVAGTDLTEREIVEEILGGLFLTEAQLEAFFLLYRCHPEAFNETTLGGLVKITEIIRVCGAQSVIITDCDEVLVNPIAKHVGVYNAYFAQLRAELARLTPGDKRYEELKFLNGLVEPTFGEVCAAGGTHKAYAAYGEFYRAKNQEARNDLEFNRDLPPIIPELSDRIAELHRRVPIVGVLTTRPDCLQQLNEQEVCKLTRLPLPCICRPSGTDIKNTNEWKFVVLTALACFSPDCCLIMIDDQLDLFSLIGAKRHPQIKGILFAGPITPNHPAALSWDTIVALSGIL